VSFEAFEDWQSKLQICRINTLGREINADEMELLMNTFPEKILFQKG
jgi:hypothetical protein